MLIFDAVQVRASAATLARMTLYIAANSAMTEVPSVGWAMDTLFPGHLMAARMAQTPPRQCLLAGIKAPAG